MLLLLIGVMIGAFLGIFIMCLFQINKKECINCNSTNPACYCEKCYQKLNLSRQYLITEKNDLELQLKALKDCWRHWKESKEKYIEELEYIRDCYYKEIINREEMKKIFRIDKPQKDVSIQEKTKKILKEIEGGENGSNQ